MCSLSRVVGLAFLMPPSVEEIASKAVPISLAGDTMKKNRTIVLGHLNRGDVVTERFNRRFPKIEPLDTGYTPALFSFERVRFFNKQRGVENTILMYSLPFLSIIFSLSTFYFQHKSVAVSFQLSRKLSVLSELFQSQQGYN